MSMQKLRENNKSLSILVEYVPPSSVEPRLSRNIEDAEATVARCIVLSKQSRPL